MPVSEKDARILFQKSGNRCAFPGCGRALTYEDHGTTGDTEISVSDIAHIVSEAEGGPRGRYPLPLEERSLGTNLILLCKECHRKIDTLAPSFPVERLRGFKEDHESRIENATAQATTKALLASKPLQTENLFATLLPVLRMPRYVHSAPTKRTEDELKQSIERPADANMMYPYILREDRLYCFNDLGSPENPFRNSVDGRGWKKHDSASWWEDEDKRRCFVDLLGRSLNKLTGRKGLMLDKEHHRYFFTPCGPEDGPALPRTIKYKPLNQKISERSVVWQPIRKKTQEARPFWYHLAVSLSFRLVGKSSWALCVRPELRITKDGRSPIASDAIGAAVTKKKARMFNNDLLEDLQLWRSFLSDDKPRIVFRFGGQQQIIVSSSLLSGAIQWPGIPDEYKISFQNVSFPEDLFSWAEKTALDDDFDDDASAEEGEEESDDEY